MNTWKFKKDYTMNLIYWLLKIQSIAIGKISHVFPTVLQVEGNDFFSLDKRNIWNIEESTLMKDRHNEIEPKQIKRYKAKNRPELELVRLQFASRQIGQAICLKSRKTSNFNSKEGNNRNRIRI